MVGALIVRGRRTLDERAQNGGIADVDTILKDSSGAALKEKVIPLQRIAYACFDEEDNNGIVITTRKASDGKPVWYCPPDKKGEVKYYSVQFGPGSWRSSGHFTMITGQMQPQFGEWQPGKGEPIHAGEIQRWALSMPACATPSRRRSSRRPMSIRSFWLLRPARSSRPIG